MKKEKDIVDKLLGPLYNDDLDRFKSTIQDNSYLSARDSYGRTIIFYAVINNKIDFVRYLIKKKVDLNAQDKEQWTPLHYAAQGYFVEIAKLLVKNGARVDLKDKFGNNVIWRAAFCSRNRGEIIKILLANGADPSVKNDSGVSALDLAETIANYDVKQFFTSSNKDA